MSLYEAIQEYKEAKVTTANKLKECILHAILNRGLGHLEETSIAVVRCYGCSPQGNEIIFTAYICRDSDNLAGPLTVGDIQLGGTVDLGSLVLLC